MMRNISLIVAVIAATAGISACQTQTTESPPTTETSSAKLYPNWPPLLNDFRFHWSAEPGIDVTTGPAMAVRAYMEAYDTHR